MDNGSPAHASKLSDGRERFLAAVLDYAFEEGWRTPQDFLRHFDPTTLMTGLSRDDVLRTTLLTQTTRVNERLAPRKSIGSAAEDLTLALEAGLTDAAKILALLPPDDCVRCLDARRVWAFLTEDEFWKAERREKEQKERLVQRVTFVLECALSERLVRLQDIADGIGFKVIATCLPHAELQRLVEHALSRAREGHRLTEEQLLEAVPLRSLMQHVPLEHTWMQVVVGRLATPLGFMGPDVKDVPRAAEQPDNRSSRLDPSLLPRALRDVRPEPKAEPEPAEELDEYVEEVDPVTEIAADLRSSGGAQPAKLKEYIEEIDPVTQIAGASAAASDAELERVEAALSRLGRLPADHAELTLPILLSIESMYTDLQELRDEGARAAVVREAFPNETHLRVALSSLIRLLDADRSASDTVLRHGDAAALISAFLFEERRLAGNAASARVDTAMQFVPPSELS